MEGNPLAVILKQAQAHAKVWNATLEIVKTVTREIPIKHSKILEMEREIEAKVRQQIGNDGVTYNVQLLVTSLEPGEKLVKFADEEEIDLIFLGVKKKSKVGKLFFGSTAQYVILQAPCPVVTVKI
jgi:nucleotide-binding universal stress UspA family protein